MLLMFWWPFTFLRNEQKRPSLCKIHTDIFKISKTSIFLRWKFLTILKNGTKWDLHMLFNLQCVLLTTHCMGQQNGNSATTAWQWRTLNTTIHHGGSINDKEAKRWRSTVARARREGPMMRGQWMKMLATVHSAAGVLLLCSHRNRYNTVAAHWGFPGWIVCARK